MALFKYKAKLKNGEIFAGELEADSEQRLREVLHGNGFLIMDIKKIKSASLSSVSLFNKVSSKDIALFCRLFSTMHKAGIDTLETLFILREQMANPRLANAISKMYFNIQIGSSLSEAMKQNHNIFPAILIAMVEVGEVSGTLGGIFARMATYFEKEQKIKQRIQAAITYPAFLIGIAILAVTFLMTFTVPRFLAMFASSGKELPFATKILVAVSTNIKIPIFIIISIIALIISVKILLKNPKIRLKFDQMLLKLPIFKNYLIKILSYRLTKTLSELINSGVPLIYSLKMCSKVLGNQEVIRRMGIVIENVSLGTSLSSSFEDIKFFPLIVSRMVRVGEKAGTIVEMMSKVSDYYEDELDNAITKFISLIEPILILVIAFIIGFIAIAILSPVLQSFQLN